MSKADRHVVITGATRGLGRALVEKLIALGHTISGCGRSAALVAQLQVLFPEPHSFETVDVASAQQVAKWAADVLRRNRAPDLLLNNAAVMNRPAPLWEISAEEFGTVIDVNVKGIANVVRSFVPAMIGRGRGVIVNLSSGWGRSTSAEVAPYCASKYAVEGLTLALAQELPRDLAAVAVNPGVIDTDMLRTCFGDAAGHYPAPNEWVDRAAAFFLKLGPRDNGKSLTVG